MSHWWTLLVAFALGFSLVGCAEQDIGTTDPGADTGLGLDMDRAPAEAWLEEDTDEQQPMLKSDQDASVSRLPDEPGADSAYESGIDAPDEPRAGAYEPDDSATDKLGRDAPMRQTPDDDRDRDLYE